MRWPRVKSEGGVGENKLSCPTESDGITVSNKITRIRNVYVCSSFLYILNKNTNIQQNAIVDKNTGLLYEQPL